MRKCKRTYKFKGNLSIKKKKKETQAVVKKKKKKEKERIESEEISKRC